MSATTQTTLVAGVPVSTDHWIGGRRVGSDTTVRRHLADRRTGHRPTSLGVARQRPTPPWPRRGTAFPGWARHAASRTGAAAASHRRPGRGAPRRSGHRRDHRQRRAAAQPPARRHASGRAQLPVLRRLLGERPEPSRLRDPWPSQPRQLGPERRGRVDHAVERPAHAGHVEGGAGAGRRGARWC